jgi:hypothetical protein
MIFMLYKERNFVDMINNPLYRKKYSKRCRLKINICITYCRTDSFNNSAGYTNPQGLFILGDKNDFV